MFDCNESYLVCIIGFFRHHACLLCNVLYSDAHSVRCEKSRITPGKHCAESSGQRVPPGTSPADVQSCGDPDSVQSIAGSTMLQFAKTRKLSIERSDLRKYVLTFFDFMSWLYYC